MQTPRAKLIAATAIVVVVFSLIMVITRGDRSRDLVLQIKPADSSEDVTVHVGGAVENPGLFALPRGSRVAEALELARLSDTAETSSLPLARVLEDEQTITVPERPAATPQGDSGADIQEISPDTQVIDINQASETELADMPGIGPVLAGKIR
ncbi:MAG: SLBB domain-containing protein, partial [Thermomicrobiaceae bacterium]